MICWTMRSLFVALGLVVALSGARVYAQSEEQSDLVGKKAPELKGTFTLNGEAKTLSELKGHVVLVDFWAVWCGPCIRTFPHLREWQEKYGDKGLKVVGVTYYNKIYDFDADNGKLKLAEGVKIQIDPKTKKRAITGNTLTEEQEQVMLKNFADHHKLKHLLLTMSREEWKEQVSENYHVRGIPTAVLVDQKGTVRMIRVGSGDANAKALEEMIEELLAK